MSAGLALLHICGGLHEGAQCALVVGQRAVLGSGEECDIRLLDPGIADQQLALEPRARRLRLRALAPGIRVRNRELRPGRRATLRGGEEIQLAAIALRYEAPAASAWRLRFGWMPAWRPRRTQIAMLLGAAALGSAALGAWHAESLLAGSALRDDPDAPAIGVRREIDATTGRTVYSGLVHDERELALLRAQWQRPGEALVLFRVAVRSRVLRTLEEVLARHYAVSRVTELQPGRYRVVTGGRACYLDAIAWDTAAVAREASEAVRGIDALEFGEDPTLLATQARLPLSSPRWTLISSPHGQWIADGTQRRYFEGGQMAEGQVIELARCSVRLVERSRKRIAHYSGEAGGGACY